MNRFLTLTLAATMVSGGVWAGLVPDERPETETPQKTKAAQNPVPESPSPGTQSSPSAPSKQPTQPSSKTKPHAAPDTHTPDSGTPASKAPAAKHPPLTNKHAIFAAVGQGDGNVEAVAIGVEWFLNKAWFKAGSSYMTAYIELLAGYWEGDPGHTGVKSLHEGGLSSYLRLVRHKKPGAWIRPYADLGIGFHYITEDKIESKELGRQWLAGSNAGVGVILGPDDRLDLGVRIRHLSNGGTDEINWGINHYIIRAAVRF